MNYKSNQPCCCCGHYADNEVTYHHIYTRKAHPELSEEKFNLMPLCLKHHNETHLIGMNSFAIKYPSIKIWLIENGWTFTVGKWRHIN